MNNINDYIHDQKLLKDVPFGNYSSDINGCGWISLYNLFYYIDKLQSIESVIDSLESRLWFGGKFGVSIWDLQNAMKKYVSFDIIYSKQKAIKSLQVNDSAIIAYWHGSGAHYTFAYREDLNDMFRFLNINAYNNDIMHISDFYNKYVKFPLVITMPITEIL